MEEAVKGDDKDAMDTAASKLSEASAALAQKLYAEQAAEAQAENPEGEAAGGPDDAVDAEFEEVKEDDK